MTDAEITELAIKITNMSLTHNENTYFEKAPTGVLFLWSGCCTAAIKDGCNWTGYPFPILLENKEKCNLEIANRILRMDKIYVIVGDTLDKPLAVPVSEDFAWFRIHLSEKIAEKDAAELREMGIPCHVEEKTDVYRFLKKTFLKHGYDHVYAVNETGLSIVMPRLSFMGFGRTKSKVSENSGLVRAMTAFIQYAATDGAAETDDEEEYMAEIYKEAKNAVFAVPSKSGCEYDLACLDYSTRVSGLKALPVFTSISEMFESYSIEENYCLLLTSQQVLDVNPYPNLVIDPGGCGMMISCERFKEEMGK